MIAKDMSAKQINNIEHNFLLCSLLYTIKLYLSIAGRLGIEPRLKASKASVLPLDDLPMGLKHFNLYHKLLKKTIFCYNSVMPTLHIICGVPCSGKSTLAKKLEKEHPALRLTPDEWMDRIVGEGYNEQKREIIEKIQSEIAEQALRLGVDVILESGFWSRKERDKLRVMAKHIGAVTKVYYCEVPREELLRRLKARNANLPPYTFYIEDEHIERALKDFELPDRNEPDLIIVK